MNRNLLTHITAVITALLTVQVLAKKTPPIPPGRLNAAPFNIGDLVAVEGYDGQLYYVDCMTETRQTDDIATIEDVHFDLTCAASGDYELAYMDDITLVARAADAEDYLANHEYLPAPPAADYNFPMGAIPMPKQTPKSPRELSSIEAATRKQAHQRKATLTDRLLDQRQQYSDLDAYFGGGYAGNLAQIDEDLTDLAPRESPPAFMMDAVELRIEQRTNHRTYDVPLKEADAE
ncbi:hypothetical protein [uncultured Planococcus sp.]|uniref:hypothetical protein n=1 Tax=uncultured Planococcus sp. TaxID=337815 RepID=UPI0026309249|nr:hypothetical protein [uncultured Planococcus sp.]